jgi:hypothetical protein
VGVAKLIPSCEHRTFSVPAVQPIRAAISAGDWPLATQRGNWCSTAGVNSLHLGIDMLSASNGSAIVKTSGCPGP